MGRLYLLIILFLSTLAACTHKQNFEAILPKEAFEHISPEAFNTKIKEAQYITNGGALIELYYGQRINMPKEGKESIKVNIKPLENDFQQISLIHDFMPDDALKSIKIILVAKRNEKNLWQVYMIRKNWRCWPDRGNPNWGTQKCV